jgi:hypothetical protein
VVTLVNGKKVERSKAGVTDNEGDVNEGDALVNNSLKKREKCVDKANLIHHLVWILGGGEGNQVGVSCSCFVQTIGYLNEWFKIKQPLR